jgi:hypothetical protein
MIIRRVNLDAMNDDALHDVYILISNFFLSLFLADHQKLEREARICRLLKHSNIGESHSSWMHPMLAANFGINLGAQGKYINIH